MMTFRATFPPPHHHGRKCLAPSIRLVAKARDLPYAVRLATFEERLRAIHRAVQNSALKSDILVELLALLQELEAERRQLTAVLPEPEPEDKEQPS